MEREREREKTNDYVISTNLTDFAPAEFIFYCAAAVASLWTS